MKINVEALKVAVNAVASTSREITTHEQPYFELVILNGWNAVAAPVAVEKENITQMLKDLGANLYSDEVPTEDKFILSNQGELLLREYAFNLVNMKIKKGAKEDVERDTTGFEALLKDLVLLIFKTSPFEGMKIKVKGAERNDEGRTVWKLKVNGHKVRASYTEDFALEIEF